MAIRTVTIQLEGDDVAHLSVDEVLSYGDVLSDDVIDEESTDE